MAERFAEAMKSVPRIPRKASKKKWKKKVERKIGDN